MEERLLHFIWQNKLFNTKALSSTTGSPIQILDFGKYNKDGGPDFWNAKIKIEDIILVGNIELHVYASDWNLHKHQLDRKYDNVILHVVYFNDLPETNLPTLELNGRVKHILIERYREMSGMKQKLVCENLLKAVDLFTIENWKERLVAERLERKSKEIMQNLKHNNMDWEKTVYQLLGKYFGSHINKEPFEQLTQLLDYKILLKHQNDIFQLEALLFGVAGFLNKDFVEIYPRKLKQEFHFLKQKYNLTEMHEHQWQFLRIRPVSFPTIRIAWFANVIQQMPLMHIMLNTEKINEITENIEVSEYWNNHYVFDKLSRQQPKKTGNAFNAMLKINVFVPILFTYGRVAGIENYSEKVFEILYATTAEENVKTKKYDCITWNKTAAFDTQALIELSDRYCDHKRCLDCAIGHKILRNEANTILIN